jgi:hypothetical protein
MASKEVVAAETLINSIVCCVQLRKPELQEKVTTYAIPPYSYLPPLIPSLSYQLYEYDMICTVN